MNLRRINQNQNQNLNSGWFHDIPKSKLNCEQLLEMMLCMSNYFPNQRTCSLITYLSPVKCPNRTKLQCQKLWVQWRCLELAKWRKHPLPQHFRLSTRIRGMEHHFRSTYCHPLSAKLRAENNEEYWGDSWLALTYNTLRLLYYVWAYRRQTRRSPYSWYLPEVSLWLSDRLAGTSTLNRVTSRLLLQLPPTIWSRPVVS